MADLDVEVFATGLWGGVTWTAADLDEMAANHARLATHIKPPVKLGHSDKQVLAGQADGQPALGWVAGLRRMGDKLVARLTGIPSALHGLIEKGRYRRLSSEIYPEWETTSAESNLQSGVTGKVLSAVALLGADIPEVKTLDDLARMLATEPAMFTEAPPDTGTVTVAFDEQVPSPVLVISPPPPHPPTLAPMAEPNIPAPVAEPKESKEPQMTDVTDAIATAITAAEAKWAKQFEEKEAVANAERKKLSDAVKERDEEIARLQKFREDHANKTRAIEAERFVETHTTKEKFRIWPAQRDLARVLFAELAALETTVDPSRGVECKLFADGETPRPVTLKDLFVAFIDRQPGEVAAKLLTEQSTDEPAEMGESTTQMHAALNIKAKELYSKGFDVLSYDEKNKCVAAAYADAKLKDKMPKYSGRKQG